MTDGICPFADVRLLPSHIWSAGYVDRVGFTDHAAGGFYTTLANRDFWIGQGYSVHFGISSEGKIVQLVNIFDSAWGQGRLGPSGWAGVSWPYANDLSKPYRNVTPNYLFISIEHEDWELVNGVARAIPGSQWTQEEYDTSLKLKRWCIDEAARVKGLDLLQYGIDSLTGHYMFDPVNRAECPGRYWRNDYRQRLMTDLTQPQEDKDMMTICNATSSFFEGRTFPEVRGQKFWVSRDMNIADRQPKQAHLEVFLEAGQITFWHGSDDPALNGKRYAYGMDFASGDKHQTFIVELDSMGDCIFTCTPGTRVKRIGILGFWK